MPKGNDFVLSAGPALNAILTVNPRALDLAAELDTRYATDPSGVGPLHCVPVVLKDNYDTADMPTTGGSVTLAESVPPDDAFVVARLREAGALILAKANLTELARGGTTVSSLGGQTRNPYDLTRTPGGSSGGTGAAIAANLGAIGTDTDTGQSIRSPASAGSLVGLRPTRGGQGQRSRTRGRALRDGRFVRDPQSRDPHALSAQYAETRGMLTISTPIPIGLRRPPCSRVSKRRSRR